MKKKTTSLALVLTLVLALIPTVTSASPQYNLDIEIQYLDADTLEPINGLFQPDTKMQVIIEQPDRTTLMPNVVYIDYEQSNMLLETSVTQEGKHILTSYPIPAGYEVVEVNKVPWVWNYIWDWDYKEGIEESNGFTVVASDFTDAFAEWGLTGLTFHLHILVRKVKTTHPITTTEAGYVVIVPPKYDRVENFSDGMAGVMLNDKWGFIDKTGKEIISPKYADTRYDSNHSYKFSDGMAIVAVGYDWLGTREWSVVDKTGKEIIPFGKYDYIESFSEGLAAVRIGDRWDGKWGFIDKTGKEIVSPQYNNVRPFSEGVSLVNYFWMGDGGIIDKTGKEIVPVGKYDYIEAFSEGLAAVRIGDWETEKWGFIDKTGKEVIPPKYDYAGSFSEGVAAVCLDNKWGFIDKTGNIVINFKKYDAVGRFSEGLASVYLDGKCGVIDKTGKEIISMREYNGIAGIEAFSEGVAMIRGWYDGEDWNFDGRSGLIDKTGKEIVPVGKYGYIGHFSEGLAAVVVGNRWTGGKWGFVDKTGKEIVSPKYDNVGHFIEGVTTVWVGNQQAVIDKTAREIIPLGKYLLSSYISDEGNLRGNPSSESMVAIGAGDRETGYKWGFVFIDPLDSASTWAREGITSALDKGFIPSDIQSNYTNVITRAEFCRMAVKWVEYATGKSIDDVLAEYGVFRNQNAFSDTNDSDILAAFALGITSGTVAPTAERPGVFAPNGQFTREQAATMIMNTCRVIGADVSNPPAADFTDMNRASGWAHPGINFVRAYGIMSGTSTTAAVFSPKDTFTRQQSIVTFNNILPEQF
jgi:hypothetical protein